MRTNNNLAGRAWRRGSWGSSLLLLLALLATSPRAEALNQIVVTNFFVDGVSNPISGLTLTFTLVSPPNNPTNKVMVIAAPVQTNVVNGAFSVSLWPGLYNCAFGNYYGAVQLLVPTNGGPYSMTDIATNLPSFNWTNYAPAVPLNALPQYVQDFVTAGGTASFQATNNNLTKFALLGGTNWVGTNLIFQATNGSLTSLAGVGGTNYYATNGIFEFSGATDGGYISNNFGTVWFATNNTPAASLGTNGWFATSTNGAWWRHTNGVWQQF